VAKFTEVVDGYDRAGQQLFGNRVRHGYRQKTKVETRPAGEKPVIIPESQEIIAPGSEPPVFGSEEESWISVGARGAIFVFLRPRIIPA